MDSYICVRVRACIRPSVCVCVCACARIFYFYLFIEIQHAPLQSNTTCFRVKYLQYGYMYLHFFILVINQLDAQNFCFTISLFHASIIK